MTRAFMGCDLERCAPNSSGMRWSTFHPSRGRLRADTLAGLRQLIREAERKPAPPHVPLAERVNADVRFVVTLPNGRAVSLAQYCAAWRTLLTLDPGAP